MANHAIPPAGGNPLPVAELLAVHHLSHDLRGPLNSVLGFAELLLEGTEGPLNDTQQTDIRAMYTSAKKLLNLINTVVDLSKLEAGRLTPERERVKVADLFQNVLAADMVDQKPAAVNLMLNFPPDIAPLAGDRNRLKQLFTALLKFIFDRIKIGTVAVFAHDDPQAVTIRLECGDLRLPPDSRGLLFDPLVYTDAAGRSELGPGGLELPLAHRLAAAHGGHVWAETTPAGETTFFVKLPVYQNNP